MDLQNKYLIAFVTLGTALYASLAGPRLPEGIARLLDHPVAKMIFYALIVLVATQNLQVAIIVAIGFFITMSMLREQRIAEGFIEAMQSEGFAVTSPSD